MAAVADVIQDHGINQPLPLDEAVTVEFTPSAAR
jgi:plastocyanin domain-containing protein